MKQKFILNSIIQGCLLFGVWLLMSGHYDFFHTAMGVLSTVVVVLLHARLRKFYHDKEVELNKAKGGDPGSLRYGRVLLYIPWMIWQIYLATMQVVKAVLSPKMPIDPALVKFKTNLPNTTAKVILGNSITLTPGTITVRIREDEFIVHALMDESAGGIIDDSMPQKVAKLYLKQPGPMIKDVEIIRSGAKSHQIRS